MKKRVIYSEVLYAAAPILLAFAMSMVAAANFGVSMVTAPAYILSLKFDFITFGQGEWVIQGVLFAASCIILKRLKPIYLSSFFTGFICGALLDICRALVPHFNPEIFAPGAFPMWLRITYFLGGMCLTAFCVTLFFKSYFCPKVYEFFVLALCKRFSLKKIRCKTVFDLSCLTVSVIMDFAFFGKITGVGIGTVIMAFMFGVLIKLYTKIIDRFFVVKPKFTNFAKYFEM